MIITIEIVILIPFCAQIYQYSDYSLNQQTDYTNNSVYQVKWNGINIAFPQEGDQVGYTAFPSTPYMKGMQIVELRGKDIKDGFKVKEDVEHWNYEQFLDYWESR